MRTTTLGSTTLLIMLYLLSGLGSAGCGREPDRPKNPVDIPAGAPDDETWNTTILLTDSTSTNARLKVGHARRYISKMETLLDSGVYVEFYASDGTLSA